MAKEMIPLTPPSVADVMLIQPNNVTFGQYNICPIQENILTLIADQLQRYMTKEEDLPRDLFNQPYVEIICADAGEGNNKAKVKEKAIDLMHKQFSFRWLHPRMNKEIETSGTIITTVHDVKKTNKLLINFNMWSLPFLMYYGIGVGGTVFNKSIALTLRGNYTKRIYKILCSQRDRTEYFYPIEQFKLDMGISENYTNTNLEQKILKPTQERIKESDTDVWFDYEMKCLKPVKGRKEKSDTILLKIRNRKPVKQPQESDQFKQFTMVYGSLVMCFDPLKSDKTRVYTDKLTEMGELSKVAARCEYWTQQVKEGKMPQAKMINSIKKMLKEDYGMD
jgi:hypothetical protein